MKSAGKIIAYELTKDRQIPKKDYKIYCYLFDYILDEFIYTIILLTIGILLHNIGICICYLLVSFPLRHFAGGVHASTKIRCTIYSYGIIVFILITAPYIAENFYTIATPLYFICWSIIILIAPVDTKNKRLTIRQKTHLHNLCIITFLVMTIIFILMLYQKQILYYSTISFCVIIDTIGLILGMIKNQSKNNDYELRRN